MSSFDQSIIRDGTLSVFKTLAKSPELNTLTLVGGTALSLQLQHRISLDLDFATFDENLPCRKIDNLVYRLRDLGHQIDDITDMTAVSRFKINTGEDLRIYVRDYVFDGIKVTFFAHGKNQKQRQFYKKTDKIIKKGIGFNILGLDGLKIAKTLVLADRVRSRDLFDLMILMRDYSYKIKDLNTFVKELGHLNDPEHYRAVMTGIIPLDKNDEGLESVDVKVGIEDIYQFFDSLYAVYDIDLATDYFSKNK